MGLTYQPRFLLWARDDPSALLCHRAALAWGLGLLAPPSNASGMSQKLSFSKHSIRDIMSCLLATNPAPTLSGLLAEPKLRSIPRQWDKPVWTILHPPFSNLLAVRGGRVTPPTPASEK